MYHSTYTNLTCDEVSVLSEFFRSVDKNRDGKVTIQEIIISCAPDINDDCKISENEIEIGMRTASKWIYSLEERQDLNGDKELTLHELLTYNNNYKGAEKIRHEPIHPKEPHEPEGY